MTILRSEGSGETSTGFFSHTIDQSLKLDDASGGHLTISSASPTATNRKKVAISCWVKRSTIGTEVNTVFWGSSSGLMLQFFAANSIYIYDNGAGGYQAYVQPTSGADRLFRDTGSWYHLVLIIDTTQSTAANRSKFYINGELNAQSSYPGEDTLINWHTGTTMKIGNPNDTTDLAGYIAEFISIDGQDVSISDFGETKDGVWVPKNVSGLTLGNAGFYLKFDNSSDIGNDSGSNNIDFTASNLATSDVVPDSPTNNFCTWNALQPQGAAQGTNTLTEGNLKAGNVADQYGQSMGSMSVLSGKWYTETYIANAGYPSWHIGWTYGNRFEAFDGGTNSDQFFAGLGYFTGSTAYLSSFGTTYAASQIALSGLHTAGDAPTTGDVIGCAADFDNGKFWWHINGEYINVGSGAGNPAGDSNPAQTFTVATYADKYKSPFVLNYNGSYILNAGQDSTFAGALSAGSNSDGNGIGNFKYAVPSGFLALCSSNLPDITIGPDQSTQADDNFNTVLFTGDGSSSNAITGVGFQPDWIWIKSRNNAQGHLLTDSVRGATKRLQSHSTAAENTSSGVASFDSDGFTMGSFYNQSSYTQVAWNWKAGGSANTFNIDGTGYASMSAAPISDGTQALTGLSANTTSKFSIATFTMPDAERTVAHGLGVKPDWIIFKNLGTGSWQIWHNSFGEDTQDVILLNTTAGTAQAGGAGNWFQSLSNTLVGLGSYGSYFGTGDYVMYSFANVEGYSRIGSYIGNGAANGTFVYTGFRPAFVLLKKSSASGDNWSMYDNKRDTDNPVREYLIPNDTQTAGTTDTVDFVSNGFKVRNAGAYINTSGATYIYLAFAEAPFKFANAR